MIFLVPFSQLPTTIVRSLASSLRNDLQGVGGHPGRRWILVSISAVTHGFGAASAVALNSRRQSPSPMVS